MGGGEGSLSGWWGRRFEWVVGRELLGWEFDGWGLVASTHQSIYHASIHASSLESPSAPALLLSRYLASERVFKRTPLGLQLNLYLLGGRVGEIVEEGGGEGGGGLVKGMTGCDLITIMLITTTTTIIILILILFLFLFFFLLLLLLLVLLLLLLLLLT